MPPIYDLGVKGNNHLYKGYKFGGIKSHYEGFEPTLTAEQVSLTHQFLSESFPKLVAAEGSHLTYLDDHLSLGLKTRYLKSSFSKLGFHGVDFIVYAALNDTDHPDIFICAHDSDLVNFFIRLGELIRNKELDSTTLAKIIGIYVEMIKKNVVS